jgi:hypothetical protein
VYGYDGTIQVSGAGIVNGHGTTVQLRGTTLEGPVNQPYLHNGNGLWGLNQPAGGPNAANLDAWKFNCVRLGINEATWNNYTTYAEGGTTTWPTPDPYGFKAQLTAAIADFNSRGYYVILVLGWAMAGRLQVGNQNQHMANQDNSITLWKSVANMFGFPGGSALKRNGGTVDDRSVLFELCNEPQYYQNDNIVMNGGIANESFFYTGVNGSAYLCVPYQVNAPVGTFIQGETVTSGAATGTLISAYQNSEPSSPNFGQWSLYLSSGFSSAVANGSTITGTTSGATAVTQTRGWYVAGHKDLLAAVRASVGVGTVGCGTPCLLSSSSYNQYLAQWGTYAPTDYVAPVNWATLGLGAWTPQLAATWHPYPYVTFITAATIAAAGTGYACTNGTASANGTTTTLIDTTQAWAVNQWANAMCYNATTGKYSRVHTNTATVLTFYSATTASAIGNVYTVGDCINLPMDETGGAYSGSVEWQAQLYVTSVGGGGSLTGVALSPCVYGTPGGNAGQDVNTGQGPFLAGQTSKQGGVYLNMLLPTNPVPQSGPGGSTTGAGTGATFNLTFRGVIQSGWPDQPVWPQVVALKNTFNGNVGVPIICTEIGEHAGTGIVGAPWSSAITAWADANNVSMLPFCYGPVSGWYNVLGFDNQMTNGTDTPLNANPGYGTIIYNWTTTHAP